MNNTSDTESAKAPEADPLVKVRILVHETKVGSLICAKDHEMPMKLSQAKTLEALGKAKIIGV